MSIPSADGFDVSSNFDQTTPGTDGAKTLIGVPRVHSSWMFAVLAVALESTGVVEVPARAMLESVGTDAGGGSASFPASRHDMTENVDARMSELRMDVPGSRMVLLDKVATRSAIIAAP